MTPADEKYVAHRAFQIKLWPWIGSLLLVAVLALYWQLYQHYPLYVQQDYLLEQLRAYKVDDQTLDRMAVMGNMAFVACGAFIVIIILLMSQAVWKEWRLVRIIKAQQAELKALRAAAKDPQP